MPVKPTINSMIICDTAILDAETRKRSLIGIFQNIRSTHFPCQHQMLHLSETTSVSIQYYAGKRVDQYLFDLSVDRGGAPVRLKQPPAA